MVLFDDRRDNMSTLEKQEAEVLYNCRITAEQIEFLQKIILIDKDENKALELRRKLLKLFKFLNEECEKLKKMYIKTFS